jgi:aspartate ammonia-lyase
MQFRVERDSLGEQTVPADAYYGGQTARAVENFPISGLRAHDDLITATILIKKAAAEANASLSRLDPGVAAAIIAAADEILAGRFRNQFVVDVYQAGAGTSHNMNANEVLANRAAEILGEPRGRYSRVHPNDHVNMSQSTNDVFPTATRLALLMGSAPLVNAAAELGGSLSRKADEFATVLKTGRTHLQDAVPMTLGQEFAGYAGCVRRGAEDIARSAEQLRELNIGATAVGTGLNAGDDYRQRVVESLRRETSLPLVPALDLFRVTQSMGDVLAYTSAMRRLAIEVGKVASDLRLLAMGPRAGLAEITLPAVQPGSSIMPGKVNPSIAEMVNQVCFQVIGCDATVAVACEAGQLELNVMMPVIAWNALHASTILRESITVFRTRCVDGILANA